MLYRIPDTGAVIELTAGEDTDAGIENYQEALRLFPPFRDDDGYTFGAVEVPCPDCDAVFSSACVSSPPCAVTGCDRGRM